MRTTLLVLAAGMGSRFGGIKQLEAVGPAGETLLEYSVHDALRAGFGELVFLIRRSMQADFTASVLARLPSALSVRLAFQEPEELLDQAALLAAGLAASPARAASAAGPPARSKPWGTGHALLCAAASIEGPFATINADDWYGPEALAAVQAFLSRADPAGMDHCMAGYRLARTTSGHGAVSRGLCELDAAGRLRGVTEHTGILRRGGRCVSLLPDGSEVGLSPEALVSMNLWGFTPAIFDFARPLLAAFLKENASSATAEFYLPAIVNELLVRGRGTITVLPTEEEWMGMTYREDLEGLRSRIALLRAPST